MTECANKLNTIVCGSSCYSYASLCDPLEDHIRKCLIKSLKKSQLEVWEPDKGSESTRGFFGYRHKSSDIAFTLDEKNCLIECKVLKDKKEYEVRNGLIQLVENAQDEKWKEAILLVFDQRVEKFNFFDDENEKTVKFVDNVQMLLSARISVIRVYSGGGGLQTEFYSVALN